MNMDQLPRIKRTARSKYIKYNELANFVGEKFKYNIWCLDQYDFSYFLTEGRSLVNLLESIEYKYDKPCKEQYEIYLFDELTMDDLVDYFNSRYNVNFEPYIDWVVRKEEDKTHKRKEE